MSFATGSIVTGSPTRATQKSARAIRHCPTPARSLQLAYALAWPSDITLSDSSRHPNPGRAPARFRLQESCAAIPSGVTIQKNWSSGSAIRQQVVLHLRVRPQLHHRMLDLTRPLIDHPRADRHSSPSRSYRWKPSEASRRRTSGPPSSPPARPQSGRAPTEYAPQDPTRAPRGGRRQQSPSSSVVSTPAAA